MKDRIRPARLAEAIADHLETLIIEGSLRPGDRLLAERELAQKLEVSRPSLREALNLLEQRGLLISGRGGTVVAPLLNQAFTAPLIALSRNPESTYDYLEFRGVIEGAAAYFAALRASDVDRETIAERYQAIERAELTGDSTQEAEADAAFHLAVYMASHNVMLLHIMTSLAELLRQDIFFNREKLYARRGVRKILLDQHRAVHDAIHSGNPEAARAAAEAHLTFTRTALAEIDKADRAIEQSLSRFANADNGI